MVTADSTDYVKSTEEPVTATYSPCCGILRLGINEPGVMHSGLCREVNGGVLGPTLILEERREPVDV